ncbi:MAG: hypothetical protein GXY36_07820 [Chloroflexi bacterium]|nr:hypothetical protein [Chloroflexota bacterium]
MNEHEEIERLTADIDRILVPSPADSPERAGVPDDYRQMLQVARLVANEDFSTDSARRTFTPAASPHRRYRRRNLRRAWAATAAAVVLVLVAIFLSPLRSLAQDIWQYFDQAEDGTMPVTQVAFAYETFTQSAYSLAPAQAETDFDILELPAEHFRIENVAFANPRREAVQIQYAARYDTATGQPHYQGIFGVTLTQIQVGDGPVELATYDTVPPEAEVEQVQVRGVAGEYVFGQWTIEDPSSQQTLTWTSDYYHQLRWRDNGMFYKLVAATIPQETPDISPEQMRDTLLALAESLE